MQGTQIQHSAQDAWYIIQDAHCGPLSAGCSVSSVHKVVVQGAQCIAPSAGCSLQGAQCTQCCSVQKAVHGSQCTALHVGFCSLLPALRHAALPLLSPLGTLRVPCSHPAIPETAGAVCTSQEVGASAKELICMSEFPCPAALWCHHHALNLCSAMPLGQEYL